MEHVLAPVLADMEIKDLTQRYANSYFLYAGKFQFCWGFDRHPEWGVKVAITPKQADGTQGPDLWQKFLYPQVNVARPPSKWYVYEGKMPFFLVYPLRKQFCRGLTRTTVRFWSPFTTLANFDMLLPTIREQWDDLPRGRITKEEHNTVLRANMVSLAIPRFQYLREVYLRQSMIAIIDFKNKEYRCLPAFEQELSEVWQDREGFRQLPYDPREGMYGNLIDAYVRQDGILDYLRNEEWLAPLLNDGPPPRAKKAVRIDNDALIQQAIARQREVRALELAAQEQQQGPEWPRVDIDNEEI